MTGLAQRVRARIGDERGVALPMVLVVFLVGFALVAAFLISIVGSAQVSSTTRSTIQAQAAAEAGIAAARVVLPATSAANQNFCTAFPTAQLTSTNPRYTVTGACDNATAPTSITLTSTGKGPDDSTAVIQAVFNVDGGTGGQKRQKGFAVDSFSGGWPAMNIISGDPASKVTLTIPSGNYNCWDGRQIDGDIIVSSGTVAIGTGCKVTGNVIASGTVEINGGQVLGSVSTKGDLRMFSSRVGGSIMASGTILVNDSTVGGNVRTGGSGASRIDGVPGGYPHVIGGDFTLAGGVTLPYGYPQSRIVGGTLTRNTNQPVSVTVPTGAWIEFSFSAATWSGYSAGTVTSCDSNGNLVAKVNQATTPTYFVCSSPLNLWSAPTFAPKTDIAIFNPGGSISAKLTVNSGDGQKHQFSLITFDPNPNDKRPSCSGGAQALGLTSGIEISAPVTALIYTPCQLSLGGGNVRGAIVANTVSVWSSPTLTTLPINVPGINLDVTVDEHGIPVPGGGGGFPDLTGGASAQPTVQRNVG